MMILLLSGVLRPTLSRPTVQSPLAIPIPKVGGPMNGTLTIIRSFSHQLQTL